MSVNVRIRNGLAPSGGNGGATEGDLRGDASDMIENTSGVVDLDGGHCLVHQAASPAMTVVVDAGVAYIPNTSFSEIDSDSIKFYEAVIAGTTGSRTLTIGANSSGQTRIDLVCAKIDTGASPDSTASNVASLIVVAGTPGAGIPATPSYYTKFAEVTVANGATSIINSVITDTRTQIQIKNEFIPSVLSSKSITKRVSTTTSASTLTANVDNYDMYVVTALAAGLTIDAPTGTPTHGKTLIYRIKDNGTARALTFNSVFRAVGVTLPPTTIISKIVYIGAIYNSTDSKYDVVAVNQET